MTTTEKDTHPFPGIIKEIVPRSNPQGTFFTIALMPRPGLQWPDKFNGLDMKLTEGFKPGDSVVLTLKQGQPKKDRPGEFWQDVVGITRDIGPETILPSPSPLVKAQGGPSAPREASSGTPSPGNGPGEALKRPADFPPRGEREAAIAQAHQENMAAHEAQMRAAAYLGAIIMGAIRAYLAKDPAPISTDAIKRAATDLWAEIKAQ